MRFSPLWFLLEPPDLLELGKQCKLTLIDDVSSPVLLVEYLNGQRKVGDTPLEIFVFLNIEIEVLGRTVLVEREENQIPEPVDIAIVLFRGRIPLHPEAARCRMLW